MQEENKIESNKHLIPLSIIAAGILIAGAIYFGGGSKSGSTASLDGANTGRDDNAPIDIAPVSAKDHIRGNTNAPIIIVEYSDIECPFCKVFHNTMKEIVSSYDGKVAWVYRHFPIPQLHKNAMKEAEATECAFEQGGNTTFWNYLDRVFDATNSNDSLDPSKLPEIAGNIGLDVTKFNECLTSGKQTKAIQASIEEAVRAGARGTPYSVILGKNGKKLVINGAEGVASVKAKIDSLLK
jgi:protein-disulfide isomerase